MRIISLVPSLTELLFHFGIEEQIVGRTKFCIHPSDRVKSIPKIGGTKNVNIKKVIELKPDIVIANKEENTKSDIEEIQQSCKVHVTEIANYKQALSAIDEIGQLTKTVNKAFVLTSQIETAFKKLQPTQNRKSVCYLIWKNPYMSIGNDTYIHDMLERCGLKNVCEDQTRYPTLTIEEIQRQKPDYIFLSSEPYPFKEQHITELQEQLPTSKIILVDGEYFSWYGSRMIGAAEYFGELIRSI